MFEEQGYLEYWGILFPSVRIKWLLERYMVHCPLVADEIGYFEN